MRQVFTLWPSEEAITSDGGLDADGMPLWASRNKERPRPPRWTRPDTRRLAVFALILAASALLAPQLSDAPLATLLVAGVAIVLAAIGLRAHRRAIGALNEQLDGSRRWNEMLFERTGIALWREDWTVVRDEVLKLLRSGVKDMQAHYATRPDQLRALRRAVIIKDVNRFAAIRMGAPDKKDIVGPLDRILPDTDGTFVQWLVAFARGDALYRSETHLQTPEGPVNTLFAAGLPRDMDDFENIIVSDLDITEYKATQARLAQAELEVARAARVTTMGALSASIAHEVNSPLAAIIANAEATLRWLRRDDPNLAEALSGVEHIIEAAVRAKGVVERTRAFLGNSPADMQPHDVAGLIQDAIILVDRELCSMKVSIHVDTTDRLPRVLADPINIQQVLINLLLNAAHAMDGRSGPRDITVTARQDGARVRMEVADRGPGIDPETMKLMFEPFYSTKAGGMGMGLAICRTCIAAHGGRLWATSTVGEGSRFHFDLPIAEAAPEPGATHSAAAPA
ncbi:MAG: hypothetical protein EOO76_00435 [Novosphingobium sp.]|nr:MAG: hypothetical protein EOO76_00435 [Novosphingobium sp.]